MADGVPSPSPNLQIAQRRYGPSRGCFRDSTRTVFVGLLLGVDVVSASSRNHHAFALDETAGLRFLGDKRTHALARS